MGTVFRIGELLDFAVEKEEQSYALYRELAENIEKKELKEVFTQLMNEERSHKDTYSAMLSSVDDQRTPGVKEEDEYGLYLKTLITEQRSLSASPPVQPNKVSEVLDYAVRREKDSVLFYVGLKEYVSAKDRDTVEKIIREEARHIVKVSRMKEQLV
jgi:rubrerythrin